MRGMRSTCHGRDAGPTDPRRLCEHVRSPSSGVAGPPLMLVPHDVEGVIRERRKIESRIRLDRHPALYRRRARP